MISILIVAIIAICWYMYTQKGCSMFPWMSCKCGCKKTSKPALPSAPVAEVKSGLRCKNAPSRLSGPSDSAERSGFDNDRGETWGSAAYLNQSPWETLQKNSPSEYELERHRINVKNPEKRVMDEIYAMNDDERFEEALKGMSHSLNPDPLIIKSEETRDDMLYRSLTDGNKDGKLNDGMYAPIDDFERQALVRQSKAGNPFLKGYI